MRVLVGNTGQQRFLLGPGNRDQPARGMKAACRMPAERGKILAARLTSGRVCQTSREHDRNAHGAAWCILPGQILRCRAAALIVFEFLIATCLQPRLDLVIERMLECSPSLILSKCSQ